MEEDDEIIRKKLSVDFFLAHAEKRVKKTKQKTELDCLYDDYSSNYTSKAYLSRVIVEAINRKESSAVVFWENNMKIKTDIRAFHSLFNEEYGKAKKPSLKSLLMSNLSNEFRLEEKYDTFEEYDHKYDEYIVAIHWTVDILK